MNRRLLSAALTLMLMLSLCLFALPAGRAAAEDNPSDLPDVDITGWEFLLANSYNSIGWYMPEYGAIEGQGLDPRVVEAAKALMAAARAEGYTIYMANAFRNTDWLNTMFFATVHAHKGDIRAAVQDFLPPGANEHQTGLAIDFTDQKRNSTKYERFTDPEIFDSELYAWLVEHAPEYGFVLRYPEGKEAYYGVACPHAHFRYVGVEAAKYMTEHGLCLEEFIMLYDPSLVFIPENGKFA